MPMCLDLVGEGSMGGPGEVHEMTGQTALSLAGL